MGWLTVSGNDLTQSKINAVYSTLPTESFGRIMNTYSDLVPDGAYTNRQCIGYIVSGLFDAGDMSVPEIVYVLENPMEYQTDLSAKELLQYIKERDLSGDLVSAMFDVMYEHKHCPEVYKKNEDWMCLVAISQVIRNGYVTAADDIIDIMRLWLSDLL